MKYKQVNRSLVGRTAKDLVGLLDSEKKRSNIQDSIAPAGATEIALHNIWQSILGHNDFGVNDDFFNIGGNSLKAIQLLSRISSQFSVNLSLTDIFLTPAIANLAVLIQNQPDTATLPPLTHIKQRPQQIPLSFNQERLWLTHQIGGSLQYNMPSVLRLRGKLNKEALSYAFSQLIRRHQILHTVIEEEGGQGYQRIIDDNGWQLGFTEGSIYKEDTFRLQNYIRQLINIPFDLAKDYMLRAEVISLEQEEHILVIVQHHIASDGWSGSIIVNELVKFFEEFKAKNLSGLPPLVVQYADFAIWQRQNIQGKFLDGKLGYWKNKLHGVAPLQLPADYQRPAFQTYNGAFQHFTIEKELLNGLNITSQQQGTTLFMTLLAAFKILLYRYSGQQDISVGTAMAGRPQQELEGLVGFFINTLALRSSLSGNLSFAELLQQVKVTTLEAFENQEVPFEKVVEAVVKDRDMSTTPLFQVMFILQNTPDKETIDLDGMTFTEEQTGHNKAKYEIDISLTETPVGLNGSIAYFTDLYNEETIKTMVIHYKALLSSCVHNPDQEVGLLPMLSSDEQNYLLEKLNGPKAFYPVNTSLVSLFEEQVSKTPGDIALVFKGSEISYAQLNEQANQLAHYLKSRQINGGDIVAICMERSASLVIGILGILKAGATYLPIDAEYPQDRIDYVLADSGAKILVTNNTFQSLVFNKTDVELICVDGDDVAAEPSANLPADILHSDIACVIYTSGSSGTPKGVRIGNDGIVNRLYWMWDTYPFEPGERNAIKTSIGFVDHIWELFGALNRGVPSVIFSAEVLADLDLLVQQLGAEKISRLVLVPSLLKMLLSRLGPEGNYSLPVLRYFISSGETLPPDLVSDFYKIFSNASHKLLNIYGCSEVTADVCCYDTSTRLHGNHLSIDKLNDLIPVGKTISNTGLYLLDDREQLVARGVTGEICVSGVQVAHGYLNAPKLTLERFTVDVFSDVPGARMFKTGDFGRLLLDGNIEYLGRIDDQVKIRGSRIELGEIEAIIQQTGLVKDCIVSAKKNADGNNNLVAYVIADEIFDKQIVIDQLRNKLPAYMVPLNWVQLVTFPLLPNGKIDKRVLPLPDETAESEKNYMPPATIQQEQLTTIWRKLLDKERIGIQDNFFELGGQSLLAMRAISIIRKELGIQLTMKELFIYPTIETLSKNIEAKQTTDLLPPVSLQERTGKIPLSFSQERLWFIDQLEGSIQYHLPFVLKLKGVLDNTGLSFALQQIINRHEVLRTVIKSEEGKGYQVIKPIDSWELSFIDWSLYKDDITKLQASIRQLITQPFNLSEDYMLRATLVKLDDQDYLLVATIHHIASDGWSGSILVNELVELYTSHIEQRPAALSVLPVQYADYAIWQRTWLQGDKWNKKLTYWQNKLDGVAPLQLPVDFARPLVMGTQGSVIHFQVDNILSDQLNQLTQQQGSTLFITLLAALNTLLYRYSGQTDICVGTPVAGRQQQETEGLIGFFVNTLALRNEATGTLSFKNFLQQVKTNVVEAFNHQEVPFEKVVELVVKERDLSRSPLFQVMLVVQDLPEVESLRLGDVEAFQADESQILNTSKFELTFTILNTTHGFNINVEYNTGLFKESSIIRMMDYFKRILIGVVKDPNQSIGLLPMLSPLEEKRLLVEFNDTKTTIENDKHFIDLFEAQSAATPGNIALIFAGEQISYKELNESSNKLAHFLKNKGAKAETLIPVFIERCPAMVVALLGILKSGAAYVPVDISYPEERVRYLIENTSANIIISSRQCKEKLSKYSQIDIIEIDGDWGTIKQEPVHNLLSAIQFNQLAYMIYTSGSTGKPKGVMIEHKNLYAFISWCRDEFSLSNFNIVYAATSICFDLSVFEIFYTLSTGKPLRILEDGMEIGNYLREDRYVLVNTVPSVISYLITQGTDLSNISIMNMAGEPMPLYVQQNLDIENKEIRNLYGPTEDTTYSTVFRLTKNQPVLIGKPIANTTVQIVNSVGSLVPIGVKGEIYLAGSGVARGYYNNADLTNEKFIFGTPASPDCRFYKTGDIGKWLPDGNIEYIGRIDEQVKVRGFRIELGEIETVLMQCNTVREAVVVAREDQKGNKLLIGYIVPKGEDFTRESIFSFLEQRLPRYMIPSFLVEMGSLPLTSNGKINKKALPQPDTSEFLEIEYVAPATEEEKIIAAIWQDVLNVERVGLHDNFFRLGGHSLLAMQVVSSIRKDLQVELTIKDLFFNPDVAALAAHIKDECKRSLLPSIERQLKPADVPLSFSQERLWFIDQLEGSIQYHSPVVLRLKGKLNIGALSHSLKAVIDRHDILRSVFYQNENGVYQNLLQNDNWALEVLDRSHLKGDEESSKSLINGFIKTPFDLSKDYPVRGYLICHSAQEFVLVVIMHHISSDAWSLSIIVKELTELYDAYAAGRTAMLIPLPLQYADYAIWQRNYLQGGVLEKKMLYWKQKLHELKPLQLPTDFVRPAVRGSHGGSTQFSVDKAVSLKLYQLARQGEASLFMVLLSVFKVLLYRYSNQQDITVGTSIASRQQKELEGLIGFFVNTLALRDELNEGSSFSELVQQVKSTTLDAYMHQDVPFEKVVETVVNERDVSRSPLFQVMMVLTNTPSSSNLKLSNVELSVEAVATNISKFDITFFISETDNGLQGTVEYSTELYRAETIGRMTDHFITLLNSVVKDPFQQIGLLPLLNFAEERQLLEVFNDSNVIYPAEKSVIDLFEEQAGKTPGNTALVFGEETLTYQQLNGRSNQLAHYLISQEVKPGSLVPLYIERSTEMMIGMLGIMKAGAAYVPIDTDFPPDRICYMLQDAGAAIVVSNKLSRDKLPSNILLTIVEIDGDQLNLQPTSNLPIKPSGSQLAYVIYTSGSTGKPKGVMIEHRNLLDYYYGLNKNIQVSECSSFALVSTIATDLGNTVIYASLLSGGALHILSKELVSNIEYLHNYFNENKIDCLKIVPSHWKALSAENNLLLPQKLLIFGGEALQVGVVELIRLEGTPCRIVNHYGPTETTIGKLLHEVKPENCYGRVIPIGKPFSNTIVYVLSKEMQLCPVGISGFLYITGEGLARGYYNNANLTEEKFTTNPFAKQQGQKMYGTGDLVKWLPDGNIEFIGRVDDQVKIRGYRIELGEIEAVLQQSQLINQSVVLAKEDKQGNKRLVAYIVAKGVFDKEEIIGYLKQSLPDYMIPLVLVEVGMLPLTANGKINRKALPDPDGDDLPGEKFEAPRNETEIKLASIWQDILELEQVGIHDDFFELGGHSLLAVRLISAIRKAFTAEMPIGDIFDFPTVALLASKLSSKSGLSVLPSIQKILPRPGRIPLSFSQERLRFIDQLDGSLQYHIPAVLRLKGNLNVQALSNALQQIINRHEILRTVLLEEDALGYQEIREESKWQFKHVDGSAYLHNMAGLHQYIKQSIDTPFNLEEDFMLRASLIKLRPDEYILVAVLHHIASDGWSASVMVSELVELYDASVQNRSASFTPLAIQYSDYAIWQRTYMQGDVLAKKIAYWKQKLSGVMPLQLPADHQRPAVQSTKGSNVSFAINKELADQLEILGKQQGATLFMVLLAAYKVLLFRYSGQEDICVGTPVAGRQQQETEPLIGYFVNTIAIRSEIIGGNSFIECLRQIRTNTLEGYEYQDTPFEKVVEAVIKERDMSRSPVFQTMFVLNNTPAIPEFRLGDVQMIPENFGHTVSMFDITLSVKQTDKQLLCSLEYCSDLFKEQTIERLITHFVQLLQSIVNAPRQNIGLLPMLTGAEQKQLEAFNNTQVDYGTGISIVNLFEEQVLRTPDKTAIIFENQQLSYRELNSRANCLAHCLVENGVKEGSLVPLCINRSVEMIIAILGILKAGGAYVPIDPDYPEERIGYMLTETSATLVLTNTDSRLRLQGQANINVTEVDGDWDSIKNYSTDNLHQVISPSQLAYVIYTSGSTGRPKGVMIEHAALLNFVQLVTSYFSISDDDSVVQQSSPSFDTMVEEVYPALISGASLVIIRDGGKDITGLKKYIESNKITILSTTPMVVEYLNKELSGIGKLRYLIVGGDVLYPSHITNFFGKVKIVNGYGPSETTVCATYNTIEKIEEASVIGKPIDNVSVYIVSREGELVPIGIAGEICIAGVGVARGYLNNPGHTAEKFIPNKFSELASLRMYKTGDAGRWLPNGKIEYLGRIDEQVKIRGYRVELGEIQHVIQLSGLVRDSIVLARADRLGHMRLVGYVIQGNKKFDKETMVSYLKGTLPEYMVPALWVSMDKLPFTTNGKLDKKALPEPDNERALTDQYLAPRNEWEKKLAVIWQELLGIPQVGITDNFFELGGDSILTIQLVSRANRVGFTLQARDIFLHQTINRLSKATALRTDVIAMGEQGELTGIAGLLPVQRWYLQTTQAHWSHYNQAVLLTIDKSVTNVILNETLKCLVRHHDALRLSYARQEGGEWKQIYGSHIPELIVEDLQPQPQQPLQSLINHHAEKYQRSLNIEKGELVKMVCMQTPAEETGNRLLIVIHHLATDGVSWRILLEDLNLLIAGFKNGRSADLGSKSSSCRQWYNSLKNYSKSKHLLSQLSYWQKIEKSFHTLSVDIENETPLISKDFSNCNVQLGEEYTASLLQDVPKAYHTVINDILLCALAVTLCKWGKKHHVVIGLEGHGREDIDKEIEIGRTVGWFTSLYPVLLEVDPGGSVASMIKGIKEQLRSVPDKGLGYGVLKYINQEKNLQEKMSWDILFNYLGQLDTAVSAGKYLTIAEQSVGTPRNEAHILYEKITITGFIKSGKLELNWNYSTKHYRDDTIIKLAEDYMSNLSLLIVHCSERQRTGSVYTPSDYGLGKDITNEELDKFLASGEYDEQDNIISF